MTTSDKSDNMQFFRTKYESGAEPLSPLMFGAFITGPTGRDHRPSSLPR